MGKPGTAGKARYLNNGIKANVEWIEQNMPALAGVATYPVVPAGDARWFNLQGTEVNGENAGGIYIVVDERGARKVVKNF
ncbi:MAG: hypothetical protein K2L28_05365 [Muribaculaceae bacterium]|nr:hypothetical protein [Muribaculaceae bacterium]